jgi:hypothetical protein
LCVSAGSAFAGPTWTPDNNVWGSNSYVYTDVWDGSNYDADYVDFNAFGNYATTSSVSGGSTTNALDWNANAAHSEFTASGIVGGGRAEGRFAYTYLSFLAGDGGNYDVSIAFDWQGSGQTGIEIYFEWVDIDGNSDTAYNNVASGPVSLSYTGTLVAGRYYYMAYWVYVYNYDLVGDIIGDGTGSGDVTLNAVPLPTASALTGFGLLCLGVRRRRVSL